MKHNKEENVIKLPSIIDSDKSKDANNKPIIIPPTKNVWKKKGLVNEEEYFKNKYDKSKKSKK